MPDLNKVFLMGNLTRNPEVRYTPKGTAVCDMGLAINMTYKTAEGKSGEEVCYVDVVVWGVQAENCGKYLSKGRAVFIEGRLQLDQWETKEGEKKSKLRVRAERVQFLGGPGGGNRSSASGESDESGEGSGSGGRGGSFRKREAAPAAESFESPMGGDDDIPF